MLNLPDDLARHFDALLIGKAYPENIRFFYKKWLRFYGDFCHKYQHDPYDSKNLPLFLQKLVAR